MLGSICESRLYDTTCFSSGVFLPYFSMLILSLHLLSLASKSICLSRGFCVLRPRQYSIICWELNLISGFFVFSWSIVWVDGINKCSWCLAGGRGCWLKGLHQIPSVSWIYMIPYTSTYRRLPHLCEEFYDHCIVITNGGGKGYVEGGCIIKRLGREDKGWVLSCSLFFLLFHLCFCPLSSHVLCYFDLSD